MPRYTLLVKADADSEAGVPNPAEFGESMNAYNQRLIEAGVVRAGEGLLPSARGSLVDFSSGSAVVTDGPFTEAKELVAGFWILELDSLDDAIAWVKRAPFVDAEVEIRQVYDEAELMALVEAAA